MDMFQNLPKPTDCTVAKDKAKNWNYHFLSEDDKLLPRFKH